MDPDGVLRALDRAAELMLEVGGGAIAAGRIDVYPNPIKAPRNSAPGGQGQTFPGDGLSAAEMKEILERIEMGVNELGLESSSCDCAGFQERYYKGGGPRPKNWQGFRAMMESR